VGDGERAKSSIPVSQSRHLADHLFMLIFAKAAVSAGLAFGLAQNGAYAEMIP